MKVSSPNDQDILPDRVLVLRIIPPSGFLKATSFPMSLAPLAVIGHVFDYLKVLDKLFRKCQFD
jgi:hypothetical protein